MYNHILVTGTRRFVVPRTFQLPNGERLISKYAPVLYLDELKDVSGDTGDAVKYVCSHSCTS